MKNGDEEKEEIGDIRVPLFDIAMFGKFIVPFLRRVLGGEVEFVEEGELMQEEKEKWI